MESLDPVVEAVVEAERAGAGRTGTVRDGRGRFDNIAIQFYL